MRRLVIHISTILAATFGILLIPAPGWAQSVEIDTQTRLVLDESPQGEPLIQYPAHVATFSTGNFVVQFGREMRVHVYESDGRHLRSLGGGGRGPFEFRDISFLHINQDDELLVFDNHQAKVSVFNMQEGMEEKSTPFASRPQLRSLHNLSDGGYLMGVRRYDLRDTPQYQKLFYPVDSILTVSDQGYVPYTDYSSEVGSVPYIVYGVGNDRSTVTVEGDLVVARNLYEGELLVYRRDENYAVPHPLNTKSYPPSYRVFRGDTPDSFEAMSEKNLSMMSSNERGRAIYYHLNRSVGLFRLQSGHIVHLAREWNPDQGRPILWLELLNRKASQVLGIREVERLGDLDLSEHVDYGDVHGMFNFRVAHFDQLKDELYLVVPTDAYEYELHVLSLDVSFRP